MLAHVVPIKIKFKLKIFSLLNANFVNFLDNNLLYIINYLPS